MPESIDQKTFYHGTYFRNIPEIEKQGLKSQGYWGYLNKGIYITEDWRIALFFGEYLYIVKLKQGTRLLDLSQKPDKKVLDYLKREFGKQLLKADAPFKVIPKNKHLKNNEVIELTRYFFHKTNKKLPEDKQVNDFWLKMEDALRKHYRGLLVRHGYHGFGHPYK